MSPLRSIYIYRLANPDFLASRAEEIGRVLFGSDGMGTETYFRVSSLTGEITYWNRGAISKNTAPDDVPRDADTAERIARVFLEESERKWHSPHLAADVTGFHACSRRT